MSTVTIDNLTLGEGSPKILVPIVGKTEEEILKAAQEVKTLDCDIVEWRIDFFEKVKEKESVAKFSQQVKETIQKPLLVTFRTKQEGGETSLSDEDYFELYEKVLKKGAADLLDVEFFMDEKKVDQLIQLAHEKEVKVVMSNHDFDGTPNEDEIVHRLVNMAQKQADICKIAVMPHSPEDVLTLLSATTQAKKQIDQPLITMSMGELGMVSRVSGEVFGSSATFGSNGQSSAPGQLPVSKLKEMLKNLALSH